MGDLRDGFTFNEDGTRRGSGERIIKTVTITESPRAYLKHKMRKIMQPKTVSSSIRIYDDRITSEFKEEIERVLRHTIAQRISEDSAIGYTLNKLGSSYVGDREARMSVIVIPTEEFYELLHLLDQFADTFPQQI